MRDKYYYSAFKKYEWNGNKLNGWYSWLKGYRLAMPICLRPVTMMD